MDLVLTALGRSVDLPNRLWLAVIIGGSTLLIAIVPHVLVMLLGAPPLAVHTAIALVWLYWLGWAFPLHWRADVERFGYVHAYRKAFLRDIVPGVCANFAQITRPGFYGLLSLSLAPPQQLAFGVAVAAAGGVLVWMSLRTIGISGAMFVYEYRIAAPKLTRRGVYGWLRHPLYVGGVAMSVGSALAFDDVTAWLLALVNALVIPIFVLVENRRCERVFGEHYKQYKAAVPALGLRSQVGKRAGHPAS